MIDPKKQAEMDQAAAMVSENLPVVLWGLFKGLKKEGFDEDRAFELVKVYLSGLFVLHRFRE